MAESGKAYKPSAYQSPGVRYARRNSRGDEALHKGFHVGVISFKNDENDSPLIPRNTHLRDAVVSAVKSYQMYIVEELGEEFKAENVVLLGKSRGAKAVLSALAELHRQGIRVSSAILEAPMLNAAALKLERIQELFKNEHDLHPIVEKATSKLKNDFLQNHMHRDRDYDLATSLDDLRRQLNGATVTIKVLKAEQDATVGNAEENASIRKLFYEKGNVIAHRSSDENGENLSWTKANEGHRFNEDGMQEPIDITNGLLIEYHEVPQSKLHGLSSIQLPLKDGPPEGGFDKLKSILYG